MNSQIFSDFDLPPEYESQPVNVPPHSMESEVSVLGGLLMQNDAWEHVEGLLNEDDFYRFEHKLIWKSIVSLLSKGRAADVITVFEHLSSYGNAEQTGGIMYLNQLAQYVPSAANTRRYAEIIKNKSRHRKLIAALATAEGEARKSASDDVQALAERVEAQMAAIGEQTRHASSGLLASDAIAVDILNTLVERMDNPTDVTGVSTGFADLDRITAGLQPGDLIVLAARPSMGKTAFAINVAEHVAIRESLPVAIFSLEMGANQLAMRVISSLSRVNSKAISKGKMTPDEFSRVAEAVEVFSNSPISIDETPACTVSQMRSESRKQVRKYKKNLGLIVVDYLQLMGSSSGRDSGAENRASELGAMTGALKSLAKEMQCPVIVLSQLNRSVEQRTDKRPMMSDLRESGAIEQDADIIMFIYRDDYYNKESKEPNIAEIIIGKHRNGEVGTIKMFFEKQHTRFENLATGNEDY